MLIYYSLVETEQEGCMTRFGVDPRCAASRVNSLTYVLIARGWCNHQTLPHFNPIWSSV